MSFEAIADELPIRLLDEISSFIQNKSELIKMFDVEKNITMKNLILRFVDVT